MSDALWDLATSSIVITMLGLVVIAALVVGYFPLLKWFPVVGEYVKAAKVVFLIGLAALTFLIGFKTADDRAEAKNLKDQIAARDRDLKLANDATEQASLQRKEAEAREAVANKRIDDYAERLKQRQNANCLLTPDDFDGGLPDDLSR